ncbi:hypothetical protein HRUBRA_01577 [Pseudohaliea rubra DSM 19751]|uniref:Uncharacterized protein n=1 Tax=Pseudohaliea rubra DSM 19751 TaxID=1265313 RepID=A0A095VR22_9GAMM|nr:hypothetical protein HRUBRA_01577 [Pseudohaliea rubra DSM 19751]
MHRLSHNILPCVHTLLVPATQDDGFIECWQGRQTLLTCS